MRSAATSACIAMLAFGVVPAYSADDPKDWVACDRPVLVDPGNWLDDPDSKLLVAEASSTELTADPQWLQSIVLQRRLHRPAGQAEIARHGSDIVVTARDFVDAARAVVAICNSRLASRDDERILLTGSAPLWAHFVARTLSEQEIDGLLRHIAAAGYYGVIVEIGGWFRTASLPDAYEAGAIDRVGWTRVAALARALGLECVPEVKLLTHQQKLLGLSRRYAPVMMNAYTYDPSGDELRRLLTAYLDEVIQAFRPRALHIGHDEAAVSSTSLHALRPEERRLTPSEFVASVTWLDEVLAVRDIETWMWADMLLDPARFPGLPRGEQSGSGGFSEAVSQLPRRVLLIDWHYYSPSGCNAAVHWLRNLGFRVMTAGWERQDALRCQLEALRDDDPALRAEGQIVTTWSFVQRREWSRVSSILEEGARLYYKTQPLGSDIP